MPVVVNELALVPPEAMPSAEAKVKAPVEENDDVAVVPKYAMPAESAVVDAPPLNCWSAVKVFA